AFAGTPSAHAQVGLGAVFGTDTNLGVQGSYYHPVEISDIQGLRVGGDLTFYLPDKYSEDFGGLSYSYTFTYVELNVNGQYTLKGEARRRCYALGGLNYAYVSLSGNDGFGALATGNEAGLNIGGGAELASSFGRLFGEAKCTLGGFGQLGLLVGVRFG